MQRRHFLAVTASFFVSVYARAFDHLISLKTSGAKFLYFAKDVEFSELKKLMNPALKPADPDCIVQTDSVEDMRRVLEANLPLRARSGGHSFEGFSMGAGIVFDVRKIKHLVIENGYARAGAGLTLGELQNALAAHGYTFPTGSCPSVGLAGYLLGGGHSLKSRLWGLGADRVQAIQILDAGGKSLRVSPTQCSDLYWALLGGGGGNFALVEEFHLDLIPARQEIAFDFTFSKDQMTAIFAFWEEWSFASPADVSGIFILAAKDGDISGFRVHGVINDVGLAETDAEALFATTPWARLRDMSPTSENVVLRSANYVRPESLIVPFKGSSQYAETPIGETGFLEIQKAIANTTKGSSATLVFEPLGGNIAAPARSNSYPHRSARYIVEFYSGWFKETKAEVSKDNLNRLHEALDPLFSKRSYVNYCDLNLSDWANRYYAGSLERLLEVKKKYDPENRFDFGSHSLSAYIKDTKLPQGKP